MVITYSVKGQPEIPIVEHSFIHSGRWVAFTLWSNTLGALYFILAVVGDITELSWSQIPASMVLTQASLWDVIFPMSFLVCMVVSFVILPQHVKSGKKEKVFKILQWKGETLHNGFVLITALEAIAVSPALYNFGILLLYGASYVIFSWLNYS